MEMVESFSQNIQKLYSPFNIAHSTDNYFLEYLILGPFFYSYPNYIYANDVLFNFSYILIEFKAKNQRVSAQIVDLMTTQN